MSAGLLSHVGQVLYCDGVFNACDLFEYISESRPLSEEVARELFGSGGGHPHQLQGKRHTPLTCGFRPCQRLRAE